jgi:hypothetical protein
MDLQIVNPDPRYSPATLQEPALSGYLHLAAEVQAPARPGPLFRARERSELLARLVALARRLETVDGVEQVSVYEAIATPPFSRFPYVKERVPENQFPRFDVVVLVETTSPAVLRGVQATPEYRELLEALRAHARRLHVVAARNAKRIADVDRSHPGLFLFNYFVADDPALALRLWDHLASWYEVETGLDNSTLLVPLEGEHSDYIAINHARWDESLPRVISRQLLKKSFRTFVQANLEANRVGAMPVLYRLARPTGSGAPRLGSVLLVAGTVLALAALATAGLRRRARH